jgi:hypothetical protein
VKGNAGKILGGIARKIPFIGGAIEALFAGYDIMKIKTNPDLTAKEKKTAIGRRVGSALGGIVGAVGGGILGTAIPIPVLGTIFGAVVGDYAGRWLGGKLADLMGGEKIYNALSFMLPKVEDGEGVEVGRRTTGKEKISSLAQEKETLLRDMQEEDEFYDGNLSEEDQVWRDKDLARIAEIDKQTAALGPVPGAERLPPARGLTIAGAGQENRNMERQDRVARQQTTVNPVMANTSTNVSNNIIGPQKTRNNDSSHQQLSRDRQSPAFV